MLSILSVLVDLDDMNARWTVCPDANCGLIAEIVSEFFVPSPETGEPSGRYSILCADGHMFDEVPFDFVVEDGEVVG